MIRVGIFGATGYTGLELIRILIHHPDSELVFATSRSHAGSRLFDVFPVPWDIPLVAESEVNLDAVDAVFCCLPAGTAAEKANAARKAGAKVIDLSADFRIKDTETYERWYKLKHEFPQLLANAVYGLPEAYRSDICKAELIANPGCYPTSVLLGLLPLLRSDMVVEGSNIISDSKSGVSGAGRKPNLKTHFVEINENLAPYNIGKAHRHLPEIEQEIQSLGGNHVSLLFSPHLVPVSRGILSTIYVPVVTSLAISDVRQAFLDRYSDEPFVRLLPDGQTATIAHAANTNLCVISLTLAQPGMLIVCSTIDNLLKGAASQAVQNLNLMFGLNETTGLDSL